MLARIIDLITERVSGRAGQIGAGTAGSAEITIRNRRYRVVALDRNRFVIEGYAGDLVARQKFACVLSVESYRMGRPVICMAMVEAVTDGRLSAVYLPDSPGDRAAMEAWWTMVNTRPAQTPRRRAVKTN